MPGVLFRLGIRTIFRMDMVFYKGITLRALRESLQRIHVLYVS